MVVCSLITVLSCQCGVVVAVLTIFNSQVWCVAHCMALRVQKGTSQIVLVVESTAGPSSTASPWCMLGASWPVLHERESCIVNLSSRD